MDVLSIPLPIVYNFQYFKPIQYVNGLSRSSPTFKINDSKVSIDLDDFPSLLKLVIQQPAIQLSRLTTCFYYNKKFDYALMDILKKNWDPPLEYVVSLFNTSCNKNIIKKIEIIFNTYNFLKNNTKGHVNKILFNPFTLVPLIKVKKNPKIQMEHSHVIFEPNVTHK